MAGFAEADLMVPRLRVPEGSLCRESVQPTRWAITGAGIFGSKLKLIGFRPSLAGAIT